MALVNERCEYQSLESCHGVVTNECTRVQLASPWSRDLFLKAHWICLSIHQDASLAQKRGAVRYTCEIQIWSYHQHQQAQQQNLYCKICESDKFRCCCCFSARCHCQLALTWFLHHPPPRYCGRFVNASETVCAKRQQKLFSIRTLDLLPLLPVLPCRGSFACFGFERASALPCLPSKQASTS